MADKDEWPRAAAAMAAPADVSTTGRRDERIEQGAGGPELGDEDARVRFAEIAELVRPARDVRVAGRIDRDGVRNVLARTAEVGRVEDGAGGRELRHEGILASTQCSGCARGRRKVHGGGRAGHVRVPGRIDGDAEDGSPEPVGLVIATAEIRGIREDRVDHDGARDVVRAEPNTHAPLAIEDVVAHDGAPGAVDLLVDDGSRLAQLAGPGVEDQIAAGVDLHPLRAVERQRDLAGIGAGREHEIVLELAWAPVVHEIDAGIHVDVSHPAVGRSTDGRAARSAARIVHHAGQLTVGDDL